MFFVEYFSLPFLIVAILGTRIYSFSEALDLHRKPQDIAAANIRQRALDVSAINQKVLGIMLKANGRRYYVSSEFCPGGIFLTKPVDENCLCYNGIFQIVRECCEPRHINITSDQLEWRMDYKCGRVITDTYQMEKPIRAIFPVTSMYNRQGSVIMLSSLAGKNVSKWHKFDLDDVIIRNSGQITMTGENGFEIVNVKPLGRQVTIKFGGRNETIVACYKGWPVQSPMNLRIVANVTGKMRGCCFNITPETTPGEISADCASGTITTELIEIPTTDTDVGQCTQDVPEEAIHKVQKRNLELGTFKSNPFKHDPFENRDYIQNILGDQGPLQFPEETRHENRDISISIRVKREGNNSNSASTLKVVIPRRRGIAGMNEYFQAKAIAEFAAIMLNDPSVEIEEPKTFRFQLLKKSIDVFLSIIPDDIVPHMLVKMAYDLFYFVYEGLESVTYEPPQLHEKALGYLDNCQKNSKLPLNFTTIGCPREIDEVVVTPEVKARLESYYNNNPEELRLKIKELKHINIKRNKRFVPDLHDIYVDINWKVVDFVHSFCFDHFEEEFNAHHFYETEVEKLFLYPDVQTRWYTKRPKGLTYVRGVFPTTKLELRMKQLDKVTAVAHHLSRYNGSYWLSRPKIDPYFMRQRGLSPKFDTLFVDGARKIVDKNIMEESLKAAEVRSEKNAVSGKNAMEMGRETSRERSATYQYLVSEKLPAGELIWDGRAVCLHAGYSNEKEYFLDSKTWGVQPSLIELGKLYPLDID